MSDVGPQIISFNHSAFFIALDVMIAFLKNRMMADALSIAATIAGTLMLPAFVQMCVVYGEAFIVWALSKKRE